MDDTTNPAANNSEPVTAPELPQSSPAPEPTQAPAPEPVPVAEPPKVEAQDDTDQIAKTESEAMLAAEEKQPEPAGEKPGRFKSLFNKWWGSKKLRYGSLAILVLLVIAAVPQTRYLLPGTFWKANYKVAVNDSATGKPVSNATLVFDGKTATTDKDGKATIKARVGKRQLKVSKKYYKDYSVKLTVGFSNKTRPVVIEATGRQVPLTITNKITGKAASDIVVEAADTKATTDKDGKVTIVLPADKTKVDATLSGKDYNDAKVTILVTEQVVKDNALQVTPAGKVYFLSKKSGKIDVVKTNLDGSNRQTVLAGTGTEEDTDTILLASRDWKFLALKANRGSKAKVYLIDTSNDKLSTIDEGDADFIFTGWRDHYFIYTVYRNDYSNWQPKAASIKSYNADTAQLIVLDNTDAKGSNNADAQYESYNSSETHILDSKLVFVKNWYASIGYLDVPGQQNTLVSISPDGTNRKIIANLDAASQYFGTVLRYAANELLIQVNGSSTAEYYKLNSQGTYTKSSSTTQNDFISKNYPTYIVSPSGTKTFWFEPRDGKNTLFIGDKDGGNSKEIATLSDYSTYGWYSDNYVLVSKNNSELYILPAEATSASALKISDYHKPAYSFYGYGYGYGGF